MKNNIDTCPKCFSHPMITRYDCPVCNTRIEGEFTGCPFCRLNDEDRLFAMIFIQTEGNMKAVERVMGISYPTIKARLARLNQSLADTVPDLIISKPVQPEPKPVGIGPDIKKTILDRLQKGEIDAKTASSLLRGDISADQGTATSDSPKKD